MSGKIHKKIRRSIRQMNKQLYHQTAEELRKAKRQQVIRTVVGSALLLLGMLAYKFGGF